MENISIQPQRVGALWGRVDKNGKQYMTGVMNDQARSRRIKVFKNKKKKEGDPDFIIIENGG